MIDYNKGEKIAHKISDAQGTVYGVRYVDIKDVEGDHVSLVVSDWANGAEIPNTRKHDIVHRDILTLVLRAAGAFDIEGEGVH